MFLLFRGSVYLSCSLVVYIFRSGWLLDMVPWNLGVTSLTSQEEGVNEKKKSHQYAKPVTRCPILTQLPDLPSLPDCSSVQQSLRHHLQVSSVQRWGRRSELTLETERQMVRPCASAQQREDLQRVVEVYQTREAFLCLL